MIAFALILLLVSAAAWIAAAASPRPGRGFLRYAALLYAALALAGFSLEAAAEVIARGAVGPLAVAVLCDLVAVQGPVALALAALLAFRGVPALALAIAALVAAGAAAIAAAVTGAEIFAAVPQVMSALCVFVLARKDLKTKPGLYLALSALSMLGGAACQLAPGLAARAGVFLFEAAALIGVALASNLLIEQTADGRRRAISRLR